MNIIADTNIYLAVALDEPEKDRIIKITADCHAISLEILPYEIGNALSAMFKQHRLTKDLDKKMKETAKALNIELLE
ncbi:MAG: hypothetical protein WCI11_11545 [Candidatus Methylumidiphilus sp.]